VHFRALLNFCQNPFVRREKTTSTKRRYMEQGAERKPAFGDVAEGGFMAGNAQRFFSLTMSWSATTHSLP
jgi:hypothetical protein